MNKLTEQELQEMTVVYGNHHHACRAAKELLSIRAELAAIKGEQGPFCFTTESEMLHINCGSNSYIFGMSRVRDFESVILLYRHPAPLKE